MTHPTGCLTATAVTVPAGRYIIGDPCYAVPNDRWIEWLEAADYRNANGEVLAAKLDGHLIVGVHTLYGDGSYYGSDGNEYGVDAGMIGLVPVEIGEWNPDGEATFVEFTEPAECFDRGGVIVLGHVEIDTNDEPEDEDLDEEDEDLCDGCDGPEWDCTCGDEDDD